MDGSVPTDRLSGSPALGAAIEAVILTARGSDVKQLPARKAGMERRALADALRVAEEEPGGPAERVGAGLRALAAYQWPPDDTDLVALIATCWDGSTDPAAAREALGALRARRLDDYSLLSLAVRDEYAFWTAEAGEVAAARDLFSSVVADRTRAHGPEHPDTLTSRQSFARWTGWAGDPAAARDLSASLVADRARVLGADHPDTLTSRFDQAFWTGEAGDLAAARDLFASVAADQAGVLGADHPDTLTSRQSHARWTARAGDPATARDLFASLVADRARVLGTDHPDTMSSRDDHAFATGEAGDATGAATCSPPCPPNEPGCWEPTIPTRCSVVTITPSGPGRPASRPPPATCSPLWLLNAPGAGSRPSRHAEQSRHACLLRGCSSWLSGPKRSPRRLTRSRRRGPGTRAGPGRRLRRPWPPRPTSPAWRRLATAWRGGSTRTRWSCARRSGSSR